MARPKAPVTPDAAVASLTVTVERRWKTWLVDASSQAAVSLPLHPPTARDAGADVAGISSWVRSWQDWEHAHPEATVVWVERSWNAAGLGRQRVPDRLQVAGVEALVTVTDRAVYWADLRHRFDLMLGTYSAEEVRRAAASVITRWVSLSDGELARVRSVVAWFLEHPASGLTPRAVPVEGVHGKWLENNRTLVTRLVTAYREAAGVKDAPVSSLADLGLVGKEQQVRLRIPDVLPGWGSFPSDVTLTLSGASSLWTPEDVPVTGVLVVENLETFLALPTAPGRVLLWGAGYGAGEAATLPWLADLPVWYWGDLDADGFAILSAVRSHLPQVRSVLMDTSTVRRWRHLATADTHPDRRNLTHLTSGEDGEDAARDLLASLGGLRIEQERILLTEALDALTEAGFYPG